MAVAPSCLGQSGTLSFFVTCCHISSGSYCKSSLEMIGGSHARWCKQLFEVCISKASEGIYFVFWDEWALERRLVFGNAHSTECCIVSCWKIIKAYDQWGWWIRRFGNQLKFFPAHCRNWLSQCVSCRTQRDQAGNPPHDTYTWLKG